MDGEKAPPSKKKKKTLEEICKTFLNFAPSDFQTSQTVGSQVGDPTGFSLLLLERKRRMKSWCESQE